MLYAVCDAGLWAWPVGSGSEGGCGLMGCLGLGPWLRAVHDGPTKSAS